MVNVVIRNVQEDAFREFKARCAQLGITAGIAASQAFQNWATGPQALRRRKSVLDFKAVDLGKGTENGSARIDELAYGD